MSQQKNETGLVINIPTSLKTQIDSIFTDFTNNQITKIYFIIYKICKEKKYQINIKNHADLLGIKTGILTGILSKLRNNNIIKSEGDYRIGAVSNSYSLITTYNCEDENNHKVFFYPNRTKVPTWVQQYITDGYTVVNKEFSKFRNQKRPKLSYEDQAKLIIQLQAELASLRHLVVTGEILPETKIEAIEEPKTDVKQVNEVPVKSNQQPFKAPVKNTTAIDVFTYTYDSTNYVINNYQKLVAKSSDDFQLQLALKKIVHLPANGIIITNNKQVSITKTLTDNYVDVYVN